MNYLLDTNIVSLAIKGNRQILERIKYIKDQKKSIFNRLEEQESSQIFPCPNNPENIKIMKQAIKEKLGK
jgi:hypothetical protein